jgi:hypothetical protein
MAAFMLATVYQLGTVTAGHLPRTAAATVCGIAALVTIAVDVRAVHRRSYSVGLQRQTAKVLAHDPNRPWWVTALFWGLDTGLIWSTFRVSATSWVMLLAALLNIAPQWSGLVYGAFFGIPLLLAVNIGDPDRAPRPRAWAVQAVQLGGVALLTTLPLGVVLHELVAG